MSERDWGGGRRGRDWGGGEWEGLGGGGREAAACTNCFLKLKNSAYRRARVGNQN